jgi:hypothetical protein
LIYLFIVPQTEAYNLKYHQCGGTFYVKPTDEKWILWGFYLQSLPLIYCLYKFCAWSLFKARFTSIVPIALCCYFWKCTNTTCIWRNYCFALFLLSAGLIRQTNAEDENISITAFSPDSYSSLVKGLTVLPDLPDTICFTVK